MPNIEQINGIFKLNNSKQKKSRKNSSLVINLKNNLIRQM